MTHSQPTWLYTLKYTLKMQNTPKLTGLYDHMNASVCLFQRLAASENVNWSGSYMIPFHTLWLSSPVIPMYCRCSQSPLMLGKRSQMLQVYLQVFLKAPAVIDRNSRCYKIRLIGYRNFGAAETSGQSCGRLQEQLEIICPVLQETSIAPDETSMQPCQRL